MRLVPSLALSALASVAATYLLRRVFAASSGQGAGGSGNSPVNVVIVMPVVVGNSMAPTGNVLARRPLRLLRALAGRQQRRGPWQMLPGI